MTQKSETELDLQKKEKELEKLQIDIGNAGALLTLERFKAVASVLTPIMTAVAILGTVYLGVRQIWAKSDSDEDERWRQTITFISANRSDSAAFPYVATLLKPFLASDRYRRLAVGVTLGELPRVRDFGTFEDLFQSAFSEANHTDLPSILNLGRRMTAMSKNLFDSADAEAEADPKKTAALRSEWSLVIRMTGVLCGPISKILKTTDHRKILQEFKSATQSKIPLDNIYFEQCDFSGIDFSDVDLSNSSFDRVALDGANLIGLKDSSKFFWGSSVWWHAGAIDPEVLPTLMNSFPPGSAPTYRDGVQIDPRDWDASVRRLCKIAKIDCSEEQIKAPFTSKH